MANRIEKDAEKLLGNVESIELGVAMIAAAFSNGEVLANIGLLRNQLACLQQQVRIAKRKAETVVANIYIHNELNH